MNTLIRDEYMNTLIAVAVVAHCVVAMQMAKVSKHDKLHKRILPCFITALLRRKINKGTHGKFGAIISAINKKKLVLTFN